MGRIGLVVAFAGMLAITTFAGALPADAETRRAANAPTTIIVRTSVVGPADAGSTVQVRCGGETVILTFDKTGAPNTSSVGSFSKVDGGWESFSNLPDALIGCTFTETANGNAASTSWTCTYASTEPSTPNGGGIEPVPGCASDAGTGSGPVTVHYGNVATNVQTQVSTVTFTNTYGAEPVGADPTFTG